jgi:hypothetical protein
MPGPGSGIQEHAFKKRRQENHRTLVDVVTVPDFSGNARKKFEARTLYFLSSWLQNARTSRASVHLACIGEPPGSVVELADGVARISVHEPVSGGAFRNKRRGFEVTPSADWLLLLDTDVLFLGRLDALWPLLHKEAVYAAPVDRPKFDPVHWPCFYAHLHIEAPQTPLRLLNGIETFPYFNGGVLLLPWSVAPDLKDRWERHTEALLAFSRRACGLGRLGDQEGLATALTAIPSVVRPLPERFNARWRHLLLGTPCMADFVIYHATGFLSAYEGGPFAPHVRRYGRTLRNKFGNAILEGNKVRAALRWPLALHNARQLVRRLEAINVGIRHEPLGVHTLVGNTQPLDRVGTGSPAAESRGGGRSDSRRELGPYSGGRARSIEMQRNVAGARMEV